MLAAVCGDVAYATSGGGHRCVVTQREVCCRQLKRSFFRGGDWQDAVIGVFHLVQRAFNSIRLVSVFSKLSLYLSKEHVLDSIVRL